MNPLYHLFVYSVWFLATYYVVFLILVVVTHRKKLFEAKKLSKSNRPFVSLIVPAYNEQAAIHHTIASLKQVTYPHVEFIIINDGSTDNTAQIVKKHIAGDARFTFLDNKHNKGKAGVLNEGIAKSTGSLVACMDADSMLEPGIFEKVIPYFTDKKMGAVTVTVEVAKKEKFLHKVFDIEYIIGLSLFLKAFSFIDSVFVTPGPFSMYRKTALEKIGGFDETNITEDLEIAYRLQRHQYKIASCMEAKVQTFLPDTFKELYVQRRRWYTGAIQTFFQHKDMMFSKKYGWFGFVMPFNYLLVILGLTVLASTVWMTSSSMFKTLWSMQYTGFNFLERIQLIEIDLLRTSTVDIVGYIAFFATFVLVFVGIAYTRNLFRDRKLGIASYPILFLLYQMYWISSFWNVVRGKKVKWR